MQLLGSYPTQLASWYKDELLTLLQAAISAGDYGGGKLVDSSTINTLNQQAQDFTSLPAIPADSRALVQSILYPLQLLQARYIAISQERDSFIAKMQSMLNVLVKDSNLIDQLVAAANMETWVSRQGALDTATQFYQDFSATHGNVAIDLPQTDPETGAVFTNQGSRAARTLFLRVSAKSHNEIRGSRLTLPRFRIAGFYVISPKCKLLY